MGIFMDRSNLPSADPSTVWLTDLIEATEAVAASSEPCDPAIVEAFSHRLTQAAGLNFIHVGCSKIQIEPLATKPIHAN
jgi:hypothetical protein